MTGEWKWCGGVLVVQGRVILIVLGIARSRDSSVWKNTAGKLSGARNVVVYGRYE